MKKNIKAIIFDYDGVIVDSFPSVFEVYKKVCNYFNVAIPGDIESFRIIYGRNYRECLKNLGIDEKNSLKVNLIFREEIVKMNHDIFAGMSDVIKKLKPKYRLYLISASHSDEVVAKLNKYKLLSFFEKIYCGADQGAKKSEMFRDFFLENNFTNKEVVAIGDRQVDYDVAREVGIDENNIIMVTYGWGFDKTKVGGAKIINKPQEIIDNI